VLRSGGAINWGFAMTRKVAAPPRLDRLSGLKVVTDPKRGTENQ
jgi:hypothetical protein